MPSKELRKIGHIRWFKDAVSFAMKDALQKFKQKHYSGRFEDVGFQDDFVEKAFRHKGFCLIESPTASGKTIIEAKLAARCLSKGKVLVVSNSGTAMGDETTGGIVGKFHQYFDFAKVKNQDGVRARVAKTYGDHSQLNDVFFFTPQGLAGLRKSSPILFKQIVKSCSLFLIDEVHHFPEDDEAEERRQLVLYNQIFEVAQGYFYKRGKKVIGLTGTCYRLDGRKVMGKDKPDLRMTVQEFVDMGRCPEIRGIQCWLDVKTTSSHKSGDFYSIRFSKRNKDIYWTQITERMIEVWRKVPKPTCAFVRTVEDAFLLRDKFNAMRPRGAKPLEVLHGGMGQSERQEVIRRIREGESLGYVTCQVGEEALDIKPMTVVHLVRRTDSVGRNMQAMGRAMRQWKGKKFVLVVDYHLMTRSLLRACGIGELVEACGAKSNGMVNGGCVVARHKRRHPAPDILSMTSDLKETRRLIFKDRRVYDPEGKMQELLEMPSGSPKPSLNSSLGCFLYARTNQNHQAYLPEFHQAMIKRQPEWWGSNGQWRNYEKKQVECTTCGKRFLAHQSEPRRAYCSVECMNERGRVKVKCQTCNKTFVVLKCHAKWKKFCSRCKEKRVVPRRHLTCPVCGRIFSGSKQTYCSKKCSNIQQGRIRMRRKEVKCATCRKRFMPRRIGSKFCSKKCTGLSRRRKVRRYCQTCNQTFFTTPMRIQDGRGKFCSKKCYFVNKKGKRRGSNVGK